MLNLRTLGVAGLYTENADVPLLGVGKPLALVMFIALAPGRRASRDSLVDLLWSDVDPERARAALRQTLFQLRRLLGDDSIVGTGELTLTLPIVSDRDRFLTALDEGDLETAMAVYRGAFLPAFGVPGGAAFEQWADLERGRLEAGFIRGAELLARRHLNASRLREAKLVARRARELVPQLEVTGRLVLEVSIAGRDFVAASMEADAIEQWATAEGVVLEPATRSALARARRIVPAGASDDESFALVAELIGREPEFFAITSAWESVRTGPARHLHLSAPAGFGKTRLLRDAVARLSAAGACVVHARGTPGDRDVPYAFASDFAAAIAELSGAAGIAPASASTLVALNPALSTRFAYAADSATGDEALRHRILALADLVHSVAEEKRFVLAIDDLHWIDASSFRVLEGLCGRLGDAHVLCLTASRPERVPSSETCTTLPLSALTPTQISALVMALGVIASDEAWTTEFLAGLYDATRGSPLLVLETLRLALDRGMLSLEANEWRCLDAAQLASLLREGEALRERVRTLPQPQAWVLALLATAGTPIPRSELGAAAGLSATELAERIDPLERLGLVATGPAGLVPAHDEIAASVRETLTPEQRVVAERCIGEFVARSAGDDPHALVRAVRHLAAANEVASVRRIWRNYAMIARQRGDHRTYTVLATELLGDEMPSSHVSAIVSALPLSWRIGLWSLQRRLLAAGVLAAAVVASAALWRVQAVRSESLQRLFFVDSAHGVTVVSMRESEFDGRNGPLHRETKARSVNDSAAMMYADLPPAISPDGRAAAWNRALGDSTILDIWLRTPAGVRRLTREPRDDLAHGWVPDGSALIGTTNRWSPRGDGDYDIAVFDTATGAARQITRGRAYDNGPTVSPDGTRVAFTRSSDDLPQQICVTAFDGQSEPECRVIGGQRALQLVGWTGLTELAVIVDGPGAPQSLVVYDWARNSQRFVLGPRARWGRLSPDRRWVLAAARVDGIPGVRDWVVPLDRPGNARPVVVAGQSHGPIRWWEGRLDQSSLIDRIEFVDTTSIARLGIGTRLRVRPLTAARIEVPLLAPVRWRSSDTTVARVDSLGVVVPQRAGETTITASLAGWRTVSKRIRVLGAQPTTRVDERWDDSWRQRWIPWGDPQPRVVTGPGGIRGFFNNGDGNYSSIGVLRQAFTARQGLGVEIRVSSLLTRGKWQRVAVRLTAEADTALLLRADQRAAEPVSGSASARCGIKFPGEGRWEEHWMTMIGSVADEVDLGTSALPLRSGAWWTLRLQVLPDGRCGIAINNRVVWLSREPIALEGEFRLQLGESSNGTTILHGPLQLWTGVRTDIDWSKR